MDGAWNNQWNALLRPILENICGSDVPTEPTIADLTKVVLGSSDSVEIAQTRENTRNNRREESLTNRVRLALGLENLTPTGFAVGVIRLHR